LRSPTDAGQKNRNDSGYRKIRTELQSLLLAAGTIQVSFGSKARMLTGYKNGFSQIRCKHQLENWEYCLGKFFISKQEK
jgi:hypothetical protein